MDGRWFHITPQAIPALVTDEYKQLQRKNLSATMYKNMKNIWTYSQAALKCHTNTKQPKKSYLNSTVIISPGI
jgi:hypothetical protein